MKKLHIVLFAIILGISFNTKAHDFSAVNSDGDTIYYTYYIGNTVAVSFQGNYPNSIYNEYYGDITIPDSVLYNGTYYKVTSIGLSAFSDNTLIASIILPSSLTKIDQGAFGGCSGLSSLTIPKNVTSIGAVAFQNCSSLGTVYFNALNCVSMGATVSPVFKNCDSLKTIIIGNNVTRIPNNAFVGCSAITSINIPSSVNSIGLSAFQNCTNLININLPSTITSLPVAVFMNCTSLKRINLPLSITSIFSHVFNGCRSLDSVIIPSSVTSLGYNIFANCDSLTYVCFPNSINALPDNTFQNCISLTSLSTPFITLLGTGVFAGCTSLTSYTLPNNLTSIPDNTFLGCTSLTSIIIPPSVTNIKVKAFQNCSSLTNINLPNNISIIGSYAFDSCTSLSIINIPNIISYISSYTFRNCTNLDTIIMNRTNPPTIGSSTFQNIPDNVTIILPCSSKLKYLNATNWSNFTNFQELSTCLYTINVQSNDSTLGVVTGTGIYHFDTITITAISFNDYFFKGWNDGDTNSIRTVIVTRDSNFTAIFKQVVYSNINDTICQGQTYSFFGNNITTEGLYYHTIAVSQTKDSIISLQLEVNLTYTINIYDTICEGENYTLNGFNASATGLFTQNLQTINGCDSIINLYLLVNQSPITNFQVDICQGQTYSLNGFYADTTGLYTLNFQTYKGCDSIVNLSLIVNPNINIDIQGEVCQGRFYYQNGFFVHMPGIYTKVLQSTKGCDSIVNLHLTVNPTFIDTIFAQICQGEVYTENGFNADNADIYSQNLQSINSCDSIIYLNLSVNEIATPTNLTLNNIANYIELIWNGDEENYIIYRNNDSLVMTTTRIYQDSNVVEGVNYCYKIKAINDNCESDYSNEECKTFLDINSIETNSFNTYLYPNPSNNKTILRIEGIKENTDIKIYDITGRLVRTLKLNEKEKELEIYVQNFEKGVYNIRIQNSTVNITKKLIVY